MTIRIQCQSKRHLLLLSSLCIALFYLYLAFQTYYISVILGRFVAIARTITPSFPHFVSFAFHLLSTHVFLLPVMSKPSQTPCVRINLLMPPKLPLWYHAQISFLLLRDCISLVLIFFCSPIFKNSFLGFPSLVYLYDKSISELLLTVCFQATWRARLFHSFYYSKRSCCADYTLQSLITCL